MLPTLELNRPVNKALCPEFNYTVWLGAVCIEFACSSRPFMGFLWLLQFPPVVQRHTS